MWFGMALALAADPVRGQVVASSGRTCQVALRVNSEVPVPIVLSMAGSGLYAMTADAVPPWYQGRVERGELAYLVFDKPGVLGQDDHEEAIFDAEVFAAYTPQDLEDCADAALAWASARDDVRDEGHVVVGHSEGALIAVSLAAAAVTAGKADRFAAVVLSGFPVEGLRAAFAHQGRGRPEKQLEGYRRAEARGLVAALRKGPGMGVATMEAWWARGDARAPAEIVVESRIPLLVQHGSRDRAVPVDWINTWAAGWHAPWLVVQLFDADHGGNLAMMASQTAFVDHFLGLDSATGFIGAFRHSDASTY